MELDKELEFYCRGDKCKFRTITVNDITESYTQALRKEKGFLKNTKPDITLAEQQEYVYRITSSDNDTICGLFANNELVGTAGIQNIQKDGQVTIGIFVFDECRRGRGYGRTLAWCSCFLVKACCQVSSFSGNMEKQNIPSFKAFTSCGFEIVKEHPTVYLLQLKIGSLTKPEVISCVSLNSR